jgi:hypothetical protein
MKWKYAASYTAAVHCMTVNGTVKGSSLHASLTLYFNRILLLVTIKR